MDLNSLKMFEMETLTVILAVVATSRWIEKNLEGRGLKRR